MALFVLQIADNGPAAMDGRLQVNMTSGVFWSVNIFNFYLLLAASCYVLKYEVVILTCISNFTGTYCSLGSVKIKVVGLRHSCTLFGL